MKIHVYVDDNHNVVSISPAATLLDSEQPASNGGVVFGNAVPAQPEANLSCYELDTDNDLSLDLSQIKDAVKLHEKCAQTIKAGSGKKL